MSRLLLEKLHRIITKGVEYRELPATLYRKLRHARQTHSERYLAAMNSIAGCACIDWAGDCFDIRIWITALEAWRAASLRMCRSLRPIFDKT